MDDPAAPSDVRVRVVRGVDRDGLVPKDVHEICSRFRGLYRRDENINLSNLASLFCISVDMVLCGYNDYCPDGRGYDPYPGGPAELHDMYDALEESQRALCSYGTA